jgi:hypothetical protein
MAMLDGKTCRPQVTVDRQAQALWRFESRRSMGSSVLLSSVRCGQRRANRSHRHKGRGARRS